MSTATVEKPIALKYRRLPSIDIKIPIPPEILKKVQKHRTKFTKINKPLAECRAQEFPKWVPESFVEKVPEIRKSSAFQEFQQDAPLSKSVLVRRSVLTSKEETKSSKGRKCLRDKHYLCYTLTCTDYDDTQLRNLKERENYIGAHLRALRKQAQRKSEINEHYWKAIVQKSEQMQEERKQYAMKKFRASRELFQQRIRSLDKQREQRQPVINVKLHRNPVEMRSLRSNA